MAEALLKRNKKHFYNIKFKHVIHYGGYENTILGMLTQFDSIKTVFVHNDMLQEIETRNNQNIHLLKMGL